MDLTHQANKTKEASHGKGKSEFGRQGSRETRQEREIVETWILSYLLMGLLCMLSFFQPTWQRLLICLAFSLSSIIHAVVSEYMTDTMYYFSDGAFVSFVLVGIVLLAKPNKFTDMMVMACAASIMINVYGWIAYENYWKADSYNIAFYILYAFVAFIFLQKEGVKDEDRSTMGSRLHLPYYKSNSMGREIRHKETR